MYFTSYFLAFYTAHIIARNGAWVIYTATSTLFNGVQCVAKSAVKYATPSSTSSKPTHAASRRTESEIENDKDDDNAKLTENGIAAAASKSYSERLLTLQIEIATIHRKVDRLLSACCVDDPEEILESDLD